MSLRFDKVFQSVISRRTILSVALALLPAVAADAQVTGDWETTALTRVDIAAIQAPGLTPQRTVDIADGEYRFEVDGGFAAGDIQGSWTQKNAKYSVAPNRTALENQFRLNIENAPPADGDPPVVVNDLRLLSVKFAGAQLDNGIWGDESYVYRLDVNRGERRQIVRVSMTVRVAGNPASAALFRSAGEDAPPRKTVLEIAAAAVLRSLSRP
jgi:hypothetical protein